MEENYVTVEHYTDRDRAAHDRELLEDAGLHPALEEEAPGSVYGENEDTSREVVYVLEVPESELEEATQLLEEFWESEDRDTLDILDDFEDESEEAKEAFESD